MPSTITVTAGANAITVEDDAVTVITVGEQGPAGPQGPQGIPGSVAGTLPFSSITSTPTTLSGYGISDAQPLDDDLTAIAALTVSGVPLRSSTGTWTSSKLVTALDATGVPGMGTSFSSNSTIGQKTLLLTLEDPAALLAALSGASLADLSSLGARVGSLGIVTRGVFVVNPADGTYVLEAKAQFAFAINGVYGLKTTAGILTLAVKINDTDVTGLEGVAVTTTPQDVAATVANLVAIEDRVTLVLSGGSSPANLEFTLKATR